jgi:hypothetical protein
MFGGSVVDRYHRLLREVTHDEGTGECGAATADAGLFDL